MIEGLGLETGALAEDSAMSKESSGLVGRGTEGELLLLTVTDLGLGKGFGLGGGLVSSRRSKAALLFEVSKDSPPGVKRTLCLFLGGLDPSLEGCLLDSALCSWELSSCEAGVWESSGDGISLPLVVLVSYFFL